MWAIVKENICGIRVPEKVKTCPVLFTGAWKDWAEGVPSELGLEDGQEFTRQRRAGRAFQVRGTPGAKAK